MQDRDDMAYCDEAEFSDESKSNPYVLLPMKTILKHVKTFANGITMVFRACAENIESTCALNTNLHDFKMPLEGIKAY